jgi:hypothetical protein
MGSGLRRGAHRLQQRLRTPDRPGWLIVGVMTVGVLALTVIATVVATGSGRRTGAVPLTDARVTAMAEAAMSCPALTAARLAGQVMATTGFEPTADGGITGLSADEWEQWKPWDDAVPGDDTASLLALAYLTCDLVGQLRVSGFSGDLWPPAVAAFASSLDDVRAASGVPASVADVVDRAQAYATYYAERVGPHHPSPQTSSADTSPSAGTTDGPTATGSPTPSARATSAPASPAPTSAPTGSNDFSIALSTASTSVAQGSATTVTVSTAVTSGSAQSVTLSASSLPAGTTASFSPATVTAGGSSMLTLQTSGSTPAGTSTITVRGSGSVTRTASLSLTVTPTCSSPGQKLGNPGFESGASPWSATSNVVRSYSNPYGGSRVAWLGGHGDTHTDTLSQTVSLPTGCDSYTFSFWLHINSSEQTSSFEYDTMTVRVLSPGGSVLKTLATYSNLDEASGYRLKSFDLTNYAGQTIQLTFTATEDYSRQTSFVVDDTALDVS